jgi:hypothetical protein
MKAGLEGLAEPRPSPSESAADGSPAALQAIKAVHTLAWFSIEACMVYVLYAGFARRSDRRAGIAAAVVAAETVIFAAFGSLRWGELAALRRCDIDVGQGTVRVER